MANPASRNFFLLWLFAAFLELVAVAVSYFRSGEANMSALILAVAFIAVSVITRSKSRGPDE